jgi:hypothetical protein
MGEKQSRRDGWKRPRLNLVRAYRLGTTAKNVNGLEADRKTPADER